MITRLITGTYQLVQTKKQHTKIVRLGDDQYAWVAFENIGEVLVLLHSDYPIECTLSAGEYRIYEVESEPELTDSLHLELQVAQEQWQGYLLLTGLPDEQRKRTRIIPTRETITNNELDNRKDEILTN